MSGEHQPGKVASFLSVLSLAAILFLFALPGASAGTLTIDTDTIYRTLSINAFGATGNGWGMANWSRSDLPANGSVLYGLVPPDYIQSNWTAIRSAWEGIWRNSLGELPHTWRNDLNHEYCMANNASMNSIVNEGQCNQANPQLASGVINFTQYLDQSTTSVEITLAGLHSRYADGDTTKDCSASGLNCPPDSYTYRATTIVSALKLFGWCPLFCVGDPDRSLIYSQWNEPYNKQYWLDLYSRDDFGNINHQRNCTKATAEFVNFIGRDYDALSARFIAEGYSAIQWATPSWPVRTSAGGPTLTDGWNDCGVYMQDEFNDAYSPNTNGTIPWSFYEIHPYSNTEPPAYNEFYEYLREMSTYARAYGYTAGIATEFAINSDASGNNGVAANGTYLNNSYAAFVVAFAQDDFWHAAHFYNFHVPGACDDVAGSGEYTACYWMYSEQEGLQEAGIAWDQNMECIEGGSRIYSSTNTSGIFGVMGELQNGTNCIITGYAKGTGTESMTIDFNGAMNVSSIVDAVTGSVITVNGSGIANLGTFGPGTTKWYFVNESGGGGGGGGPSGNGTVPVMAGGNPLLNLAGLVFG